MKKILPTLGFILFVLSNFVVYYITVAVLVFIHVHPLMPASSFYFAEWMFIQETLLATVLYVIKRGNEYQTKISLLGINSFLQIVVLAFLGCRDALHFAIPLYCYPVFVLPVAVAFLYSRYLSNDAPAKGGTTS